MNRRILQNPSYGATQSNFGFVTVNPATASGMIFGGAALGALFGAVFIGSDPAKNAMLKSMVSPGGGVMTSAGLGAAIGALISAGLFAYQQGG